MLTLHCEQTSAKLLHNFMQAAVHENTTDDVLLELVNALSDESKYMYDEYFKTGCEFGYLMRESVRLDILSQKVRKLMLFPDGREK